MTNVLVTARFLKGDNMTFQPTPIRDALTRSIENIHTTKVVFWTVQINAY